VLSHNAEKKQDRSYLQGGVHPHLNEQPAKTLPRIARMTADLAEPQPNPLTTKATKETKIKNWWLWSFYF